MYANCNFYPIAILIQISQNPLDLSWTKQCIVLHMPDLPVRIKLCPHASNLGRRCQDEQATGLALLAVEVNCRRTALSCKAEACLADLMLAVHAELAACIAPVTTCSRGCRTFKDCSHQGSVEAIHWHHCWLLVVNAISDNKDT